MANKKAPSSNARIEKAVASLADRKLDALYVTSLHNVRYLTGFTGSNGAVLLTSRGDAVLFTDPRYTVQSKQQASCSVVVAQGPVVQAAALEIAKRKSRRVGFEADNLAVTQFEALEKAMPSRVRLKPVSGLVEKLRMVKDAGEIALIRESVVNNSAALQAALQDFRAGMTESELAAEIDYRNRKLGAEAPAFDTIVAAGKRSALPHAHPGSAKIGPGTLLIDMGAFRDGYASDMTRMAHVGKATAKYRKMYHAVLEAQLAAIDCVKAGAPTASVDGAARRTLRRHKLDRLFIHSTGHGLGLEIHEPPRIGKKDPNTLEAGMVITIEPGVYLEGWGGIRIEDTVLVTASGCEILTPTTKDLVEI
jgi:Xaa-Pro aminopeptidase